MFHIPRHKTLTRKKGLLCWGDSEFSRSESRLTNATKKTNLHHIFHPSVSTEGGIHCIHLWMLSQRKCSGPNIPVLTEPCAILAWLCRLKGASPGKLILSLPAAKAGIQSVA